MDITGFIQGMIDDIAETADTEMDWLAEEGISEVDLDEMDFLDDDDMIAAAMESIMEDDD